MVVRNVAEARLISDAQEIKSFLGVQPVSRSGAPISVRISPLVLTTILDSFARKPAAESRAIGTLLGHVSQSTGNASAAGGGGTLGSHILEITDCFRVIHSDDESKGLLFDQSYHRNMLKLRSGVYSSREHVVGWFTCGDGAEESGAAAEVDEETNQVHSFFRGKDSGFKASDAGIRDPVYLQIDAEKVRQNLQASVLLQHPGNTLDQQQLVASGGESAIRAEDLTGAPAADSALGGCVGRKPDPYLGVRVFTNYAASNCTQLTQFVELPISKSSYRTERPLLDMLLTTRQNETIAYEQYNQIPGHLREDQGIPEPQPARFNQESAMQRNLTELSTSLTRATEFVAEVVDGRRAGLVVEDGSSGTGSASLNSLASGEPADASAAAEAIAIGRQLSRVLGSNGATYALELAQAQKDPSFLSAGGVLQHGSSDGATAGYTDEHFQELCATNLKNTLMISYLSNLARTQIGLAQKIGQIMSQQEGQ